MSLRPSEYAATASFDNFVQYFSAFPFVQRARATIQILKGITNKEVIKVWGVHPASGKSRAYVVN